MEVGIILMRYTKALMAYAEERGAEGRLYYELVTPAHSFCTVKGFRATPDNLIVSADEKFSLICTAAGGDNEPSKEFIRFARLIFKERRGTYLQFAGLMHLGLYWKEKHIGVGKLATAVLVDKAAEERIRQTAAYILRAYMELETVIDPSIKGGFIFDINDCQLDASIATQLKKVKQQLIDKNRGIAQLMKNYVWGCKSKRSI